MCIKGIFLQKKSFELCLLYHTLLIKCKSRIDNNVSQIHIFTIICILSKADTKQFMVISKKGLFMKKAC